MTDIKRNQISNFTDLIQGYSLTSRYETRWYSDFLCNTVPFSVYLNGVLNTTLGGGTDLGGRPGQVILTTGTLATGEGRISTTINNLYIENSVIILETSVSLPVLCTAAQEYEVNIGIGERSKDIQQGIHFYYDSVFTGTNWILYCKNGFGVTTQVDSGITVVADTWYRLSLVITTTRALFYINGVLRGTLTTNFPLTVAMLPMIEIGKWVGTTARIMYVDYVSLTLRYYTPR
jgi:hypothetical protein